MPVLHHRAARINAGPAALPRAIAEIEIFHVGGLVHFVDAAQRAQFRGVVKRAAAAAVEHVGAIFAGQGFVAAHRKILGPAQRHHGLAGLFAAHTGREENLRGGAEELRHGVECPAQRPEESGLDQHVVI